MMQFYGFLFLKALFVIEKMNMWLITLSVKFYFCNGLISLDEFIFLNLNYNTKQLS